MKNLLLLFLLAFSGIYAQQLKPLEEVSMNDLTSDLMIMDQKEERIVQSLWLPPVYWKVSLQNSEYKNTSMPDMMMNILKGYSIFAVLDIDIDKFSYGVKKNVVVEITDQNNNKKTPLKEETLPKDVSLLVNQLKPSISQMLGQYGANLTFFVFDADGLDPNANKDFEIKINDTALTYKLPLAGLVKNKVCPEDKEELNGSWDYCPWHGKKLKEL